MSIEKEIEEVHKQFQKYLDKALEGPYDTLPNNWTECWYQLGIKHGLLKAQTLGGENERRAGEIK